MPQGADPGGRAALIFHPADIEECNEAVAVQIGPDIGFVVGEPAVQVVDLHREVCGSARELPCLDRDHGPGYRQGHGAAGVDHGIGRAQFEQRRERGEPAGNTTAHWFAPSR